MNTPDTKERVMYNVTFVTMHAVVTTHVVLDDTEDEDYTIGAASELVSEELGLADDLIDIAHETTVERLEN
jgi:hypothetical protein